MSSNSTHALKKAISSQNINPIDPKDVPFTIYLVLASKAVKHIIEVETQSVANAGMLQLWHIAGTLQDTCMTKV